MIEIAVLQLVVALVAVFGVWLIQLRTKNAGVVDAAWVYIIAAGGLLAAALAPGALAGRALCGALAAAWGLRLGTFLLLRNLGPHEERRYAELRARWGAAADRRMLAFYVFQALIAALMALTFLPLTFAPALPALPVLSAGVLLAVAGVVGEGVADAQLQRFKRDAANRGRVMDRGLWRYSRHPNFFFECVYWLGLAVLAIGAPQGALGAVGLATVAFLLLKVSGIPTVEAADASRRRAGYADYVARTSAFIPWPPRRR